MGGTQHNKLRGITAAQIIHITPLPAQEAHILNPAHGCADAGSSHGGGDMVHGLDSP